MQAAQPGRAASTERAYAVGSALPLCKNARDRPLLRASIGLRGIAGKVGSVASPEAAHEERGEELCCEFEGVSFCESRFVLLLCGA